MGHWFKTLPQWIVGVGGIGVGLVSAWMPPEYQPYGLLFGVLCVLVFLMFGAVHAFREWRNPTKGDAPQSAVDELAELRSRAIHEILNAKVSSPEELEALRDLEEVWQGEVARVLVEHFPKSEVLGFTRLGVIVPVSYGHATIKGHGRLLSHFTKRLHIIEGIIERRSR